jgi:hypothetical protein
MIDEGNGTGRKKKKVELIRISGVTSAKKRWHVDFGYTFIAGLSQFLANSYSYVTVPTLVLVRVFFEIQGGWESSTSTPPTL